MIIKHPQTAAANIENNEKLVKGQPRLTKLTSMKTKHGSVFNVTRIKYPLSNTTGYRLLSPTGILYLCSSLEEGRRLVDRGARDLQETQLS